MTLKRIKELRTFLRAEYISLNELIEIEEAFALVPDKDLPDLRENAMASDMLDVLESTVR